jgi:TorA maturation chaperone TorD
MMEKKDQEEIALETNLSEEDLARADLYGLLALLFYEAPPIELLNKIAEFGDQATPNDTPSSSVLQAPWDALVRLAQDSNASDWAEEYAAAFIGVGKQEIFLYGSYYLSGFLNEKPLVALREDLKALGLAGSDEITETEDHIACLCEVMRYLIAGENMAICNLTQQKRFFDMHIRTWSEDLFAVLENHPKLRFYNQVGSLAKAFFEVEAVAFDMV